MKISETEKLNLSIIHGSRAYSQWEQDHDLPDYLVVIMYELLIRGKLTQRELVNLSDLPKQSINKGIKILRDHELEQKTAQAMGTDKMKLLAKLSEEWSTTFWHFLSEERSKNGKL